jgi:hypothetical protein
MSTGTLIGKVLPIWYLRRQGHLADKDMPVYTLTEKGRPVLVGLDALRFLLMTPLT